MTTRREPFVSRTQEEAASGKNLLFFFLSPSSIITMPKGSLRCSILGHSIIRDLQQFCSSPGKINFDLEEWDTLFIYKPGAHISDVASLLPRALAHHPHVVIFQIGGNDFTGLVTQDHRSIPDQLVQIARQARSQGARRVYLCKLFVRGTSRYLPSSRHVDEYNQKVQAINTILTDWKPKLASEDIHIWSHKGQSLYANDFLSNDGTHFNPWGMTKLWKSVRGALVQSKSLLAPHPFPHG